MKTLEDEEKHSNTPLPPLLGKKKTKKHPLPSVQPDAQGAHSKSFGLRFTETFYCSLENASSVQTEIGCLDTPLRKVVLDYIILSKVCIFALLAVF